MARNKLRTAGVLSGVAATLLLAACSNDAPASPEAATEALSAASLPPPYNEADVAAGEGLFLVHKCGSCHFLEAGAGNRIGPNLHGVFDRRAASLEGFAYSEAFKTLDLAWTPEEVDRLITDPKAFAPGTSMFYNGVYDETERKNLIAYLMVATSN